MDLEEENIDDEVLNLGFINLVGEENDGYYRYQFIFTNDIDNFWGDEFSVKPSCLSNDIKPSAEYVTEIHTVIMKIKLDLAQDSCCFCYQDCIDDCVALASENLDEYEDYPEDGRLVFHFGEDLDNVSRKLAMKNIVML